MKMFSGCITDIDGIVAGHYTDEIGKTGCTAILCPHGATAGVDVRGAAPGTRETALLSPGHLVKKIHGVLLSGGSAFGLDAAGGVMAYLEEHGFGFDVGVAKVPIVPAAVLFDLTIGNPSARPNWQAGYTACTNAGAPLPQGSVGAGCGATYAKWLGSAKKGGIGCARVLLASGITVAAAVAVNAFGDVAIDYPNMPVVRLEDRQLWHELPGANTTIGVVATDAALTTEQANRMAMISHDGMARVIRPAHTMSDGDTMFAMATCKKEEYDINILFEAAAEVTARAIVNAVLAV